MERLIVAAATGCYSGLLPRFPGTWGSLLAFVPWFFCRNLSLGAYLAILAGLFVIGGLAAGSAEKIFDRPDPACIVIDEIFGMFVTLTLAPDHPAAWLLGFLLFRIISAVKPFPVAWLKSHVHGGFGIMLDDAMAGCYACAAVQALWLPAGY